MFKDTFAAKNVVFLTDSHSKVYVLYMQSRDFPSNPSPWCCPPLVFDDIKKDNINLVLLKD